MIEMEWCGTEDEQRRERMIACEARRKKYPPKFLDDDCGRDGACAECEYDMAVALRCPRSGCDCERCSAATSTCRECGAEDGVERRVNEAIIDALIAQEPRSKRTLDLVERYDEGGKHFYAVERPVSSGGWITIRTLHIARAALTAALGVAARSALRAFRGGRSSPIPPA